MKKVEYVAGFLFDAPGLRVALIEKQRPAWQRGKFNAIGGHIENGETPEQAMRREFQEEKSMSEQFDEKTDAMALYGFRYCLGRASYAVLQCANYLIAHWQRLSPNTQKLIHKEIEEAFESGNYGHGVDKESWQRVLEMPLTDRK